MKVEKVRLSELRVGDLYIETPISDAAYAIVLSYLHIVVQPPTPSLDADISVYRITLKEVES